ncbi:complement receptor type 1-like isoform X2 [Tyto alba]|uniref:complement receptor type 1-like isoform X2 n=1 Tax=Tyto alba TaxID=56313 RepID=UPI001C67C446|nr:complement receptor type 1-like isoform X2 [Tyto alba]
MELRWVCAVLLVLPGAWGECPQPPRFAFAEPLTPPEQSYAVGATQRYRCRPGYTVARDKAPVVTCLDNSTWSENPDFCIGKSCGPVDIPNGKFNYTTNLLFGATITYTCDLGYRLIGKSSAKCVLGNNEVVWDSNPYCEIIPCLPPPVIKNGQVTDGDRDFTFGMAVTYSCNKGFSLIGDATIHCMTDDNLNGVWSSPAPECKVVRCKNPEVKNGKKLSGFGTEHTYKNSVTFECKPGYLLNGSNVVTCEAENTWKPPLPTCDPIFCGPAPHFPFAELTSTVGNSSLAETKLSYRCKPGYTAASGKTSVVTCLIDKTWSADPDFCIRQQCTPPTIANGDVIADNFLFETVVTFTCHPGYELKESSSAKCVVSGNGVDWDTAPPYCESGANMIIVGIFPLLLAMLIMNV